MEGNRFSLPSKINPNDLEEYLSSRQCQVVAFFGKTPLNLKSNKGNFIDEVIGQSVFSNRDIDHDANDNIEPVIEGYYCPDRDVIFLHILEKGRGQKRPPTLFRLQQKIIHHKDDDDDNATIKSNES